MTPQDLIDASLPFSDRFKAWFAWVLPEEEETDLGGNIRVENQHDGAGYTVAGLTQRDDGISIVTGTNGKLVCTNSPEWFVSKYLSKYWNGCRAEQLPPHVGECVANFYLNTGEGVRFLQQAINARGGSVSVDNAIGPITIKAALADPDCIALAKQVCAEAMVYYNSIAHKYPPEDLEDWTRRTSDLQQAFCS